MIKAFFKNYIVFFLFCLLQKPVFLLFYHSLYKGEQFSNFLRVIWHGIPLDAAVAGYFTIIPALLIIAQIWTNSKAIKFLQIGYYTLCALILSFIFVGDLALYKYWGFRLDSTPLFYLFSSPKDAFASATFGMMVIGFAAIALYFFAFIFLCKKFLLNQKINQPVIAKLKKTIALVFLTAALFIPIRGGFTVATLNTGRVYFSSNLKLNHAAVNPCFSLLESLSKNDSFGDQYRFFSNDKASKLYAHMQDNFAKSNSDTLLNCSRPNIVFVILESFMSKAMGTLNGINNVAVTMDSLGANGILFTNFYANSFRTDRGIVSILSGYPAQPTTSIMKLPRKSQDLPSIAKTLNNNGYSLQYIYGGDANFTNMRSYLTSMGFTDIISDSDFPISQKLSKWGAHDNVLFDKIAQQLQQAKEQEPFMKVIQTSSSHEPFEVPFNKLSDKKLNSIAFTDSCLGSFINKYKTSKYWKNTIFVLVPDHSMQYPDSIDNLSFDRYKIPLIICGGALKHTGIKVSTIGSQNDIAATILGMLGYSHNEFIFSKDLFNEQNPHFGYFTFPDAFGIISDSGYVVYNNTSGKIHLNTLKDSCQLEHGKAFLQKLYDDLDKRGNKNLQF